MPSKIPMTIEALRKSDRAAISRTEAAELFDVDPRSISRAIDAGEIPVVRFGSRIRIPREPLLAMLTASVATNVASNRNSADD